MKTITKILAAAFVLTLANNSYGQANATATASTTATIITPISITKTMDMNFGNVAVNGVSGTVVLSTADSRSRTGGVTLPGVTGSVKSAAFKVDGDGTRVFTIALPSSPITLSDGVSGTMTVGTFVSTPATTGTLAGGTATVKVGATLNVNANQTPGIYTNASDLFVTVDYQ